MKKYVMLLLTFTAFLASFAQVPKGERPDFEKIKRNIKDKKSVYYYPILLQRMHQNDTTLTLDQYKHLYFGYIFQSDFDPYQRSPKMEELKKYNEKENLDDDDIQKAMKIANESLKIYPYDFRVLDFLMFLNHEKGNSEIVNLLSFRYNMLLKSILSTGDGVSCDSAFHVTSTSHEYALMDALQLESISQSLVGNKCDYQKFPPGKYKIEGMYFDVTKLFGM